jgi:cell surface protein SprA
VDVSLKNSMTFGARYNQNRTLNMLIASKQLSESRDNEFTFSFGYRTSQIYLPFRVRGKKVYLENDINMRLDMSIRDNIVIVRSMDVNSDQPTSGAKIITIRPNIDYAINQNLNMRFFFDMAISQPHVSQQPSTTISKGGISLRYTLDENFLKNQTPAGKKKKTSPK